MRDTFYSFTMTQFDGTTITLSGNKEALDDVLEDFKSFLLGCTYSEELVNKIYMDGSNEYNGN